jgi:hypothetical protein
MVFLRNDMQFSIRNDDKYYQNYLLCQGKATGKATAKKVSTSGLHPFSFSRDKS